MIKKDGQEYTLLRWVIFCAALGALFATAAFTFIYAKGYSYFSNDPRACINCHVMNDVYDQWNHSTHKAVASCNDCHLPHDFKGKIITKSLNGWHHSVAFTTNDFHEPIRITERNKKIALKNCVDCHANMVSQINHESFKQDLDCLRCHSDIGH